MQCDKYGKAGVEVLLVEDKITTPGCDLTHQCLVTPLCFLTVFVFKEFLYRSSLSVVWGGRRFLLALTIHAAIGQSRSKPPVVAGIASSFLAMPWSSGNRVADLQYGTLELLSHSGSDRYTSSSDIFMDFAGGWRKLKMDLRLRSFPLIPSQFSSELAPDASISVSAWLSSLPSCSFFTSFVWSFSASREGDSEAFVLSNAASTMVRASYFDGGVRKPVWSSSLASENGWKKISRQGQNSDSQCRYHCSFSLKYSI